MVHPIGIPPQPPRGRAFTFISRWGINTPSTRTHVRLLGPCFKTGCREAFRQGLVTAFAATVRVCRTAGSKSASAKEGRNPHPQRRTPLSRATNPPWLGHTTSRRPRADDDLGAAQHCFTTVPFQQFQVLFHSLFKVLFIFPSRYLFAIGLPPIFSFRWNLPPTLSCNPKQLDSLKARRTRCVFVRRPAETGLSPSPAPFSKGLGLPPALTGLLQTTTPLKDFQSELFPLHSPLLRESWLVSFPPLINMLKFSGSSCLIGGPMWVVFCVFRILLACTHSRE